MGWVSHVVVYDLTCSTDATSGKHHDTTSDEVEYQLPVADGSNLLSCIATAWRSRPTTMNSIALNTA